MIGANHILARQLDSAGFAKGICEDVGRWALPVALAVAEDESEVAVAVEVVLVDALQYAAEGNVQVLSRIAKMALAKIVETARGLGSSHSWAKYGRSCEYPREGLEL